MFRNTPTDQQVGAGTDQRRGLVWQRVGRRSRSPICPAYRRSQSLNDVGADQKHLPKKDVIGAEDVSGTAIDQFLSGGSAKMPI